jgi:hypothetical protein
VLVALGVGFGLGGLFMKLLEPVRSARPRRREAIRPRPAHMPRGDHPVPGTSADLKGGPDQDSVDIGPDRLRQLLDRGSGE